LHRAPPSYIMSALYNKRYADILLHAELSNEEKANYRMEGASNPIYKECVPYVHYWIFE
jgi:hypothetical protein